MSKVMAQLNYDFNTKQLIHVMNSITDHYETDAGYSGEGHKNWKSKVLYSQKNGMTKNIDKQPVIDELMVNTGLTFLLIRYMKLSPGGIINKHADSFLTGSIARIHIPVCTHPDAHLFIDDERCNWSAGQLWFGDFSKVHWGYNNSNIERIHLVMDVELNHHFLTLLNQNDVKSLLMQRIASSQENPIDPITLKRFCVELKFPPKFYLPGFGNQTLDRNTAAKIIVYGRELILTLNDQPMLRAIPILSDTISLVGLPYEVNLQYYFEKNQIKKVSLNIPTHSLQIAL